MGVFDDEARKIVPHALQNARELGVGFLREGRPELRERGAASTQARTQTTQDPGHRVRRTIQIEVAERAKKRDCSRSCKTFNAAEPVPPGLKARVWIGGGDARFQLLDEGDVSRRPVLDLPEPDPVGRSQSDSLPGSGGQHAGPVGGRRTPEAGFEDRDGTDLIVCQPGPSFPRLPFELPRRQDVAPLGGVDSGAKQVVRIAHRRLLRPLAPKSTRTCARRRAPTRGHRVFLGRSRTR